MTAKKKAKEVKAWAWQYKDTGALAYTFTGRGHPVLHTAATRKSALEQGVYSQLWRLVRVSIKVLSP